MSSEILLRMKAATCPTAELKIGPQRSVCCFLFGLWFCPAGQRTLVAAALQQMLHSQTLCWQQPEFAPVHLWNQQPTLFQLPLLIRNQTHVEASSRSLEAAGPRPDL